MVPIIPTAQIVAKMAVETSLQWGIGNGIESQMPLMDQEYIMSKRQRIFSCSEYDKEKDLHGIEISSAYGLKTNLMNQHRWMWLTYQWQLLIHWSYSSLALSHQYKYVVFVLEFHDNDQRWVQGWRFVYLVIGQWHKISVPNSKLNDLHVNTALTQTLISMSEMDACSLLP